ncbi:MAG: FAD-dependent oxidoreductase, partial [Alphaproteobacteria bacterium]
MAEKLPSHAQVVIVGGGIVGCSVAYHLTKLGWRDVVLVERGQLSCGTTWHAAGLVGQLRATLNLTRLAQYTCELYATLEDETGQATGFKQNGSLAVARTPERMIELKRGASMARCFGLEVEVISPREAGEMWPLMRTDDLAGAVFIAKDGQTNPTDTTMALAKGARMGGARIFEGVKVTAIHRQGGAVAGVTTDRGDIACEYVVNCGGMWAREIGRMCGVTVPLHGAEHMYIVTKAIEGVTADLPTLRDPDGYIYLKEDAGKLVMGGFEPVAKPWGMDGIPDDFAFSTLNEDWEQFEIFMENGLIRVPALATAEVRQLLVGVESFTPDDRYMLGEAPELRNFFVAAGFNSIGIQSAGGAGKALAEWMVEGAPAMDLWDVDIRRFHPFQGNPRYLHDRTVETVGLLYAMHWPFRQVETARPLRCSPLHDRLKARGACFGETAGWERANWFAPEGVEPKYVYTYGRQNWFAHAADEHRAVREAVGLFDQTSFAKFLLEGRDAEAVLQPLCANDVSVPVGKVVYTAMLNENGGIECDLTVTRLAEDRYFIVTSAAVVTHDFDWIRRHIPEDAHAVLTDVTSAYAVLGVMGPRSREVLSRLTDADLSNGAFPYQTAQEINLGHAPVQALRISYVGELGWELYVATEFAAGVYDAIVAAGTDVGLRHAGYHAMNSLRMEKAYRSWGHDISGEDTPLEAGLGFAVAFDKNVPFIGRDALLRQRGQPRERRLVVFTLDDPEAILLHDEPIYRDGELIGRITSGDHGHSLGREVGLGYVHHEGGVDAAFLESGGFEVEIATERY